MRARGQKTREGAASAVRNRHDRRHRDQLLETHELFDADKRPGEKCGLAATNGHIEAAQALVAKGADIDGKAYETTPLLRATFRNRIEVIDWLLDEGADPNATGWLGGHAKGVTAFHLAASDGLDDVIERLRNAGARADLVDDLYHATPAGWARFYGHPKLAAEIEDDGRA